RADVVSLHCPLDDSTRGLIDDRALSLMKPGALLVNVSRGPVVDRAALERALDAGHLGGVGLDVFWQEPRDLADPVCLRVEVVLPPRASGFNVEDLRRVADTCLGEVARVARSQEPPHPAARAGGRARALALVARGPLA